MANISYKASMTMTNRYGWNGGNEYEDEGELNYSNTFYRKYDAQIGRFTGVDMLAEQFAFINPYQFGYNNPVMFNDPMGDQNCQLPTGADGRVTNGRLQKGRDGEYHVGWLNELLWNDVGFFDWNNQGDATGDYSSISGVSSRRIVSNLRVGDKFGQSKSGTWGYWSRWADGQGQFRFGALAPIRQVNLFRSLSSMASGGAYSGATMSAYAPSTNWAGRWDNFNNNGYTSLLGPARDVSKMAHGIANSIWSVGSNFLNKSNFSLVGDNVTNINGQNLNATFGKSGAEWQSDLALFNLLTLPLGAEGSGAAAVEESISSSSAILLEEQSVFIVTKEGVVLPRGGIIPSNLVENQFRSSTYGTGVGRNFVEKLRIDPPRFAEPSHFHVNGQGNKLTIWRWF
jgi:RHS repeat-associated protein